MTLASEYQIEPEALKNVLCKQLYVLKSIPNIKIPLISINSDDELITKLLQETLEKEYKLEILPESSREFKKDSLVIFFRKNYSDPAFQTVYQNLDEDIYLITAGVLHKLLIIDNLYFTGSGLPTHFSHLHQLICYLNSEIPATKNNWLLFYREMVKNSMDQFPMPELNSCQRAYSAYCLYQFISQYTNLCGIPTTRDQINTFWHADLTNFSVYTDAALHSPFSEYDMKINLQNLKDRESA
jgi:McbB family protein